MSIFGSKSKIKEPPLIYGRIFNYIKIDSINEKNLSSFYWEKGRKRKGLLAGKVEMIYLEPGDYSIIAHGVTYQTIPALIQAAIEANKSYILGANEGGLFLQYYYDEF